MKGSPKLGPVPGRARPRAEVLTEFQDYAGRVAQALRERWPAPDQRVLDQLFMPVAEEQYRWRVRLECGCVMEVMTHGPEEFPDETDWTAHGQRLQGELPCQDQGHRPKGRAPDRQIVEWVSRREVTFPPSPEEDPHDPPLDPKVWALLRHDDERSTAFWTVKLTCGHTTEVCTDLDWKPADGHHRVTAERKEEMLREYAELGPGGDPIDNERIRRWIEEGCPRPPLEVDCYACTWAQQISRYQRIGWLVTPPKPPPPPKSPQQQAKEKLERATREAERAAKAVERAQRELAKLEDQAATNTEERNPE